MTLRITLLEALVGFSVSLTHLDKKALDIKRSSVTFDGQVIAIRGRGMPVKGSGKFGDLLVTVKVKYPTYLDEKRKDLLKEALSGVPMKA